MDKLKHIAEIGDFIAHGDDSFIDDEGITNRWAQRRRARLNTNNQVVQGTYTVPTAEYIPNVLEAIREEQERMNRLMAERLRADNDHIAEERDRIEAERERNEDENYWG